MRIVREIGLWMWAVISAWYGWVGASATAGMIGFGQGMKWWESPSKSAYIAIIVSGFVISVFQAWVLEHRSADVLANKVEELTWPDNRPMLSFDHWGRIEPKFLAPDSQNNPSLLAQYGFYVKNDGGVALEVAIQQFRITSELLAVAGKTPRVEAHSDGFVPVWIDNEVPLSMWCLDIALEKEFNQRRPDLASVLKDDSYLLPISVTYRDFNNNWYITYADLRYVCDLWYPNRIEFTAPRQERFMQP
jgi:hypothetical protein